MRKMDCCSSNYVEFNKHNQHNQFSGMNANSPANNSYYPPMYNSHHPVRYPSHHPALHHSPHYPSMQPHNDEILGTNYRMGSQQQSFYDVGGGVSNANIYDRYNNTNFQSNSYGSYSSPFNNYGPLKDCYNHNENVSGNYFYHHQNTQQQQHLQQHQQQQQIHQQQLPSSPSPYYGTHHHPYDSYRNISTNFPYHHPVQPTPSPSHPAHPFNYQSSPNLHREFYPYNSEHYNNSNNNTRYYPTPPPSAPPMPLPFSQPLRESYPIRGDPGLKMPTQTIPPPAKSFPHMDPLYSQDPHLKSNNNVNSNSTLDNPNNDSTITDPSMVSPKSLPASSDNSVNSPNELKHCQDADPQKSIKTPLPSPHSESPQPQKHTELQTDKTEDSTTKATTPDDKNEQREKISPTSTPNRPQTSCSPQNQLEKQTTEESQTTTPSSSSLFENNVESNTNQNNSRQQKQITPTTCATGYPYNNNNNCNINSIRESNSSRARKSPRDNEKMLKSISSCHKMLDNQTNNDSLERCGTPFVSVPPYHHAMGYHNHHPHPNSNPHSNPQRVFPNHSNPPHQGYWYPQSQPPHHAWMMNSYPRNRRTNFMDTPIFPSSVNYQNPFERHKMNGNLESSSPPSKRTKKKSKPEAPTKVEPKNGEISSQNVTPLPGFQQAFGSTEIGRFSEAFFNTPESPNPYYNSLESDVESPQPWEYGDSLEGPHINLQIGATFQPVYANELEYESPPMGNYFSELACNDF